MPAISNKAAGLFGLACCLLLHVGCGPPPVGTLSAEDERVILQLVVDRALGERQLPGLDLLESQAPVVLWEDARWQDLDLAALPSFEIMDAEAIAAQAERQGAFVYLNLDCCDIQEKARTVRAAVRTSWASPADDRTIKLSGGAIYAEVQRVGEGWQVQRQWTLVH